MKTLPRREFLKTTGLGLAAAPFLASPLAQSAFAAMQKERPNVLFVLADDLGWRDTEPYGTNFYDTPNVQRLAERGMLFTEAYAANPLCSPTRASILTGQYPARLQLTAPWGHSAVETFKAELPKSAPPNKKTLEPSSASRLHTDYYTLGNALKDAGYATGFFGKWHLGHDPYIAKNQGFDTVDGGGPHPGPASYFSPFHMQPFHEDGPPGEHIDDHITDKAIDFIRSNKDQNFYCNLWFYDVHAPYQGKQPLIDKYELTAQEGAAQRNPVMGAMIETMDTCLGRVLDELDALGLTDKTMIVFFSDNGGVHWPEQPGGTPTTSNAPLRGGKATIYEGGTREPMIVSWPGVIEPGTQSQAFISSVDFYPTLLEITGAKPKADQVVDGISFLPVLQGGEATRDTIYGYMPHQVPYPDMRGFLNYPSSYVRRGDWKLIRFHYDGEDQKDRLELYNLRFDIGETTNLAEQHPEIIAELNPLIEAFHEHCGSVLPQPNPNYNKATGPVQWEDWVAEGGSYFDLDGDTLTLHSDIQDPRMRTSNFTSTAGPCTLRFKMKSELTTNGEIYFATQESPAMSEDKKRTFTHHQEWAEHEVKIDYPGTLTQVRIDPGNGAGDTSFEWIEIVAPDGSVVRRWDGKLK